MERVLDFDSVEINRTGDGLVILDQTRLPSEESFLTLKTLEEVYDAIYHLKVRGAPAIGIAAAYGIYLSMIPFVNEERETFLLNFNKNKEFLLGARPTAVNLGFALRRMGDCLEKSPSLSSNELLNLLRREADAIKEEDKECCRRISKHGLSLLRPGFGVLTHCNAGHLAVSRYGTALGPIHLALQSGMPLKLYVDETRPLLQGARLTAYELKKGGGDVTLICDNMAGVVMKEGKVDIVMVGCDRVAANGDVANKVGTSSLAIIAKYYGIPFYVLGPSSSIDTETPTGEGIVIEERPSYEVTDLYFSKPIAPKGVNVYNPAFDVTPASLITGIITENGIFTAPYNFKKND